MGSSTSRTPYTQMRDARLIRYKFKTKIKSITLLMIGVNVVLVITISVTATVSLLRHASQQQKDNCTIEAEHEMKDDYKRYCFRASEKECLERRYDSKDNGSVCCGNSNEHLYSVMSEEISQKLRSDASKVTVLNKVKSAIVQLQHDPLAVVERPAAHVGILQNGNLTGPDSEVPRVQWEMSREQSFVSGGVIHGGDRLRVTKPGYYYLYTGLQFNVDPKSVKFGAIVAYLYRHLNGTRESRQKLMTSRESSCWMTRDNGEGPVSMYMAGIYLLRNNDEISVRTTSQSLLHRSPASTYLGLHMV